MTASLLDSLPELEEQLAEAQDEARAAQEKVDALEQIVGGIRRLNGHAGAVSVGAMAISNTARIVLEAKSEMDEGPRGREAVRIITTERPGIWALKDLTAEVIRRGWAKNTKSVEVAVHRLTNAGEARRVGTGRYEFPAPEPEDDA
jgi:hypothetical protein